MAYCTTTDVYLEAGTSLGTIQINDITSMITRSDAEIADILTVKGVTAPSSSTLLKTASIALTIAKIKRRQSQELSRTNSASVGGDISYSVSPEAEAAAYEAKAKIAIDQYVLSINGGVRVSRVRTSRCH
jgi:uncharacterized membrane protein